MIQYAIKDTGLVLDEVALRHGDAKQYTLKIHDMPVEDKPREKLRAHGPSTLSTTELVAILLSSGTKKEDVMSMATRITHEYGERSLATHADAKKLSEDLDIPEVKAMQIVAAVELGRRFFNKRTGGATIVRTPQDVYDHVGDMKSLHKEHLRGLYLNTHYQVIHDEVLSIGTISSNLIHPREVFKPAIEYNAAGVILVHNHPSGIVTPSQADINITSQLVSAGSIIGIHLIDHVIVTAHEFTSVEVKYE